MVDMDFVFYLKLVAVIGVFSNAAFLTSARLLGSLPSIMECILPSRRTLCCKSPSAGASRQIASIIDLGRNSAKTLGIVLSTAVCWKLRR
jgi:hypothetical protein